MKFERLIKLVREEKVSLFIGSGLSLNAGAPSANTLCKAILSQIDDEKLRVEHQNDSLADLSNYFVEEICCGSRNSLIELLEEQFNFTPINTKDQQALSKIPHFHRIFTTNYDTLLEDSYDNSYCQVIRKDTDCAYIDDNKVCIIKIHGDFKNQDYIVITSNDYHDFLYNNKNPFMKQEINRSFLKEHMLFIGYSLKDDNIINIIDNIAQTINKNQKEMFLIAPEIDMVTQGKLKAMKIQYFNATATDFLDELTRELNKNICNDYRRHKVKPETFSRYCHIHNIDPVLSPHQDKDNQIIQFKSSNEQSLKREIRITTDQKYKHFFDSMDFEKYGTTIKNSRYPHVPLIPIPKKDLTDFSISINDIVVKDDAETIYFGPSIREITLSIRMPSRDFFETVKANAYSPKKNKGIIEFDCGIFNVQLIFELYDNDAVVDKKATFSITFNDYYDDNNEALKWIELLCGISSNETLIINDYKSSPLKQNAQDNNPPKELYSKFKNYYENIKTIESFLGKKFDKYQNCDEDRYNTSCILVAYYKNESIQFEYDDEIEIETEGVVTNDYLSQVKKYPRYTITSTEENQEFRLNDRSFAIPLVHSIIEPCYVKSITNLNKGNAKIVFHCESNKLKKIYTDKTIEQIFPFRTSL